MASNTASIRTADRERFAAWCKREKLSQSDAVIVLLNLASMVDRMKLDEARTMQNNDKSRRRAS